MSKVLLIEDSQPLVTLLMKRFILEGIDCEFIIQTGELSREYIVDQIVEKNPGLIILDLNMPGAGGIAVLEELRFREKETHLNEFPIVILTSLQADPKEIDYLKKNAHITDFIQKPIKDISAFVKHIKRLI